MFEELVDVGSKLLVGFQQALGVYLACFSTSLIKATRIILHVWLNLKSLLISELPIIR